MREPMTPHQTRRRLRPLVATVALASLAVACGSSDASSDDSAPAGDGELIVLGDDSSLAEPVDASTVVTDPLDSGTADGDGVIVETDDVSTPAAGVMTEEEQALAFAQCMRDEGLDWPDPTTAADGSIDITGGVIGPGTSGQVDLQSDDFANAAETCGPIVEGASFLPGGGGGIDAETQDQLLQFAQCLRDEGVDVDDPDFGALSPGGGGIFGDFDPQDPANSAAIQACQTLFAGGLGG
ncbi:MAG: hypothetical protein AB8G26_01545 [Ilumatobacter sp.]